MKTEYWTLGKADEDGLTFITQLVDDDGNLIAGYPNIKKFYKAKQITKEEYDAYQAQLANDEPNVSTIGGLLSAKGQAYQAKQRDTDFNSRREQVRNAVEFTIKWAKKWDVTDYEEIYDKLEQKLKKAPPVVIKDYATRVMDALKDEETPLSFAAPTKEHIARAMKMHSTKGAAQ